MRPQVIVNFERLMFLSIALSAVEIAMIAALGAGAALWVLGVSALLIAVSVALVLLISRRGSQIAKWALVLLTLLGAGGAVVALGDDSPFDLTEALTMLALVLQIVAVAMLFGSGAKTWFAQGDDEVEEPAL